MSVLSVAGTFLLHQHNSARGTRNTLKASMAQQATLPFRKVRVEFSSTCMCRFPTLPRQYGGRRVHSNKRRMLRGNKVFLFYIKGARMKGDWRTGLFRGFIVDSWWVGHERGLVSVLARDASPPASHLFAALLLNNEMQIEFRTERVLWEVFGIRALSVFIWFCVVPYRFQNRIAWKQIFKERKK